MKKYILLLPLVALGGCETMFAHFTLNEAAVKRYAEGNSFANICVSSGNYSPDVVKEYNYYAALLLDFSVFNRGKYEGYYQAAMTQLQAMGSAEVRAGCEKIRPAWDSNAAHAKSEYFRATREVATMRGYEIAQFGRTASAAGQAFADSAGGGSEYYKYSVPPVKFEPLSQNRTDLYLINTKNGFTQCRTTTKGYVFCI